MKAGRPILPLGPDANPHPNNERQTMRRTDKPDLTRFTSIEPFHRNAVSATSHQRAGDDPKSISSTGNQMPRSKNIKQGGLRRGLRRLAPLTALTLTVGMTGVASADQFTWYKPVALVDSPGVAISCPNTLQCTAVGGRYETSFDVANETGAVSQLPALYLDGDANISSISCPTTTECVTVDYSGVEVSFNPQVPNPHVW